ncbi:MAG: 30S ribosomal protein S16 [Dehalococcoidia bacterium]
MLKIRLRRTGKKRTPYYRVVVAEKEAKRDGAFLETLGSYDPHTNPPTAEIDADKTREWIRKGAQPSEAAVKVLQRVGILEAPVRTEAKVAPALTGKSKGKDGSKAAARAAAPAAEKAAPAAAAAAAVAETAAPAAAEVAEAETAPEAQAAVEPAEAVVEPETAVAEAEADPPPSAEVDAKAAPEAGEPATEDVMEAAVEGTPVEERQAGSEQAPGDDAAGAEAPTVE